MATIKFVEDKIIDWERVRIFLRHSVKLNQWTNFGPVSHILEKKIHEYLKLKSSHRVVVCTSGTLALNALIELHQCQQKKNLKWIVSCYGFYCTTQGPLNRAKIVDCNYQGMLDLDLLQKKDFDGMVVTNIFGLNKNLNVYRNYCKKNGKIFICDSATAFENIDHGANEILSFHHTKPWGMGEGGCAIIEKKDEELFRALIGFGIGMDHDVKLRSTNGKISDLACAFILQRIEELPRLSPIYREQYTRIVNIAKDVGFVLVSGTEHHPSTPPNVPLLYHHPIANLTNPYVDLLKYYKPLGNTKVANDLYARIINVPCHPGMQNVSDKNLEKMFRKLLQKKD